MKNLLALSEAVSGEPESLLTMDRVDGNKAYVKAAWPKGVQGGARTLLKKATASDTLAGFVRGWIHQHGQRPDGFVQIYCAAQPGPDKPFGPFLKVMSLQFSQGREVAPYDTFDL